jgi:hypothetical protein
MAFAHRVKRWCRVSVIVCVTINFAMPETLPAIARQRVGGYRWRQNSISGSTISTVKIKVTVVVLR